MNVKRRRSGFTLLEILIVIGVILVLMSLAVISYQVVERAAARNQTKVTLDNLNAMLAELDATAGSSALPKYTYQGTDAMGNPITVEQAVIGAAAAPPIPGALTPTPDGQIWTIGDVSSGGTDRNPPYYPSPPAPLNSPNIVNRTQQIAMAALMRIPNNAKAIAALPASRIMKDSAGRPYAIPILLDGWGNPIIYVPRGGVSVYVTTGSGAVTQIVVKARDNRPFFASAGPDGDFGAVTGATKASGDDNVYSKE